RVVRKLREDVAHGARVVDPPDHLVHDPEPARARHLARVRCEVARDEAQERRLARAVRPDERDLRAVPHTERDVGEQLATVGKRVGDPGDVDMTHGVHPPSPKNPSTTEISGWHGPARRGTVGRDAKERTMTDATDAGDGAEQG